MGQLRLRQDDVRACRNRHVEHHGRWTGGGEGRCSARDRQRRDRAVDPVGADSRAGEAIVTATGLAPGVAASGTVTITNTGTVPGALALRSGALEDTSGQNGNLLSSVLELELTDITAGSNAPVFSGALAEMPPQELLTLPGGGERTYRFSIMLPDGGVPQFNWSDDNRFQHASTRFSYEWTLSGDGSTPAPCSNELRGDDARNYLVGTGLGDRITGLGGSDRISALAGEDCVDGGSGKDTIRVRGGRADVVICGNGKDRIIAGPRDRYRGCESVAVRRPAS